MNRLLLAVALFAVTASAQSLGEAARAARAQKQRTVTNNPRVVTNDSLGMLRGSKMSEASTRGANSISADASNQPSAGDTVPKPAGADSAQEEAATPESQKKQLADDMAKVKAEIDQLTRELDVAQRENRLRAATYYADAGNRLRNEGQYAAEDRRYQQEIQNKQSALNAAKQRLEGLREQARRMGVPAS